MTGEIVIAALVAFVAGALLGGFVVFHSDMETKIMEDRSGYRPVGSAPTEPPTNPPNQGSAGYRRGCVPPPPPPDMGGRKPSNG